MRPGPRNAITDVAGVRVGQVQRLEPGWATGTSVVLVPAGATAGVDVRGAGPGTRETDLLDPSHLVQQVHAVVLTGGSAYGLAAADGVLGWLAERGHGFRVGPSPAHVVPIVPAAVLFDLFTADFGNTPDADFGRAACAAAGLEVAQGSVGAGTGARAGVFKGGVGTASVLLTDGIVVSALMAVNPAGAVVDVRTGLPWGLDHELGAEFGLRAPLAAEVTAGAALREPAMRLNTTIGVVATDAGLSKAQCRRVAVASHDGLARAVRPAHSMLDGDTVFALATGQGQVTTPVLDAITAAAADCVARAIVHGVLAAVGVAGVGAAGVGAAGVPAAGVPSYRDVYPSAFG